MLETEVQTAARVAKLVFDTGLARVACPADVVGFIRDHVCEPEYGKEPALATKAGLKTCAPPEHGKTRISAHAVFRRQGDSHQRTTVKPPQFIHLRF
jgi:hypothetical protein